MTNEILFPKYDAVIPLCCLEINRSVLCKISILFIYSPLLLFLLGLQESHIIHQIYE